MFEYMASKVPIIVSDLPAVRDVLGDKTALIVKPGDAESLAEVMQRVLQAPGSLANLANAAYQLSKRYTWRARAETIIDFIS